MPPRSGKISSALNAFESTIQKNAESGEHCGMYITNKVGKSHGGVLSRSSHRGGSNGGSSSRREASRSPSRNRREGGGRRSSSRSPSRTREASRVRGGTRSSSKSPSRRRHRDGGEASLPRSSSRSPSRRRSSSRPRLGGGHRSASRSPSRHRGGEPVNEARKAAERLKKRADNSKMHGRPRRKERPTCSDQSNVTDTTGELTIEDLERPGAARGGWNSFEDSANFFSEAEGSSVGGGDADDDFSIISESTFDQPEWNPDAKKKKKPLDPNASWASGFAVASYQQRNDESDSEDDQRGGKEQRSPRKDRPRQHRPLKKSGSSRNMQPKKAGGGFAVTYQHRNEESDSDFDAGDMREKIRRKQQKASGGSSHTLERMGSFKLTRSTSSNSLGGGSAHEDLNSMSCSALNTRSLHGRKQSGGDGFSNMVVGGPSSFHASFLGGDDSDLLGIDDDVEPSFDNLKQKTKIHGTTSRQGDSLGDVGAFGSAPKPARPARKYGAAAAAENMANLPPAFQTMARKQMSDKNNGQSRRHHGSSRPSSDRRARPHKENPLAALPSSEELGNAFSADRSFFDCV